MGRNLEPVASRLRAEMAQRGITQGVAAEHLGMLRQSLNDRLRGRSRFTYAEVVGLAELLDLPIAALTAPVPVPSQPTPSSAPERSTSSTAHAVPA